jgi:hypothetical protein
VKNKAFKHCDYTSPIQRNVLITIGASLQKQKFFSLQNIQLASCGCLRPSFESGYKLDPHSIFHLDSDPEGVEIVQKKGESKTISQITIPMNKKHRKGGN